MVSFDSTPERPEEIEAILNGLDRYNPDTTTAFQDYVQFQCKNRAYDLSANLALLKLYQFNPSLMRDTVVTTILVKSMMVFPSPDFSLCLALLPPHILIQSKPTASLSPFAQSVKKLDDLNTLLATAQYGTFWSTFHADPLFHDLTSEIDGFEESIRIRIAIAVSHSVRKASSATLKSWFSLSGNEFEQFVTEGCGWSILEGGTVEVPLNSENETKSLFVRENVKFPQFGRVVRRALEQSA